MNATMWDSCKTIGDVLDTAALAYGDRPALRDIGGELSFAELRTRARRFAASLLSTGLRPGDRVLEAIPNSIDVVVSDMALALAGLVRVPLNPRLGVREWQGIASDSGARALLVDDRARGAEGERISEAVSTEMTIRVDLGEMDALINSASDEANLPVLGPDDLIGLAYSSGTTGMPKGAQRTQRMRLASMRAMLRDVLAPTGESSAYLHAGPAIHTSGLFILPMIVLGTVQVMAHHPTPAEIAKKIETEGITHLAVVPSVIDALTSLPASARSTFGQIRMLAYAGAPMPPALMRRAAELLTDCLVQYYGLVEAMPPLAVLSIDAHRRGLGGETQLLTSAGRIVEEAHVEVIGGESTGELTVRGPMVTPGYWNSETRTDLGKAIQNGALLTGDIGRIEDELLWLTDRSSDMMISGGYNVYPSEIEAAVDSSPGIRSAVVVGVPDERWGQRITLVYATADDTDLDDAENSALHDRIVQLARHKRPKDQIRLFDLPLGATGKVDRRAVVAQVIELQTASAASSN